MFVLQLVPAFVVIGGLALFLPWLNRAMTRPPDVRYGVGALAARLGFQIIEGNPDDNLLQIRLPQIFRIELPFIRGPWSGLKAEMVGTIQDRNAVIRILDQLAFERGLHTRITHIHYDGHIAVEVRAPFPAFEVISRTHHAMMAPESKLTAPVVVFGDAQLDSMLVLRSPDARIAPVIREAMRGVLPGQWLCIRGQQGQVVFDTTPLTKTMLFDSAEPMLNTLALTATAIEIAAAQHMQVAA